MTHVIDTYVAHVAATAKSPARDIRVFITDVVIPHEDKVVLKHLYNSSVDIMALSDMDEARTLYADLEANCKLVTSQENVNIRYQKWYLAKLSTSDAEYPATEDPSIGPSEVYNEKVVKAIADRIIPWCKSRKFQSFITFEAMWWSIAHAIYGDEIKAVDEQQTAVINFVESRFTSRFCVLSPFNNKGYNLGSELMLMMYPNGVKYRAEKYVKGISFKDKTYFFLMSDGRIINGKSGKTTVIPASTLSERSSLRLKVDTQLYYSNCI